MAEDNQDQSQKTEEPTQRRIQQAREKGQVARSQEVNHWFMILAMTLVLALFAGPMMRGISDGLIQFVAQPHAIDLDSGQLRRLLSDTLARVAMAMAGPAAVFVLAALVAGVIQNGLVVSTESITPKLEKISPARGLKRLFSIRSLVEFTKGVAKIGIVAAVLVALLLPEAHAVANITGMSMIQLLDLLQSLATRILIGVLVVMTAIATLDFLYQKQHHLKQLRMSKQDLKEEFKQTEGDPLIRARLRQIRIERARRRMMAAVPEADVVVTNPTHYAVALKYDPDTMEAPRLTAKGADAIAFRIREVAKENDIPIVENPPLTRALYEGVDLDQEVPPEHYKVVAEIISYVLRLKGKTPARRAPTPG